MKYFLLIMVIYCLQAVRVYNDVDHFQNNEKCKPCFHHRTINPQDPFFKDISALKDTEGYKL